MLKNFRNYKRNSSKWRTVFDVAVKKERITEVEKELEDPKVWKDQEASVVLSKELSDLKDQVEEIGKLGKELKDLKELAQADAPENELTAEVGKIAKRIDRVELKVFLSGEYDKGNAICTITAGAGGQDAQDWAAMLLRMYERYCERKGWKLSIMHRSFGEMGAEGRVGIKQASFEVRGAYAYGYLQKESGVHRLVRLSPFSSKSLRHTSFAALEIIPDITTDQKEIEIDTDDITVDLFKSSGPGGQNVNKRETAVRITHTPTGIVAASQSERSQQRNREQAMKVLMAKLYQLQQQEQVDQIKELKGKQLSIEWGSQIRSYVLHPYTMVKDHRTDLEVSQVEDVLDGDLDQFIEAELKGND